ncbi:MAG TPA: FAD-dependent oxidoreductase, partial [bacterium]|nr:FAD-dependent oxidoreductase [bacterium]
VQSIQSDQGNVISATLKSGIRIDCELVIIAIGVLPNIDLVKNTAIKTDRGIVVDGTLQSTVEGIYAAGDVAQAFDLVEGGTRPIPILPVAYRQGWVAGLNMAGRRRLYRGGVAMNAVDVCGLPTISVGITVPATNEYEILSSLESSVPRYRKIVLRDNRIVGFILIGDIDRAGILTGLIRDKIDVTSFKESLLTDDFGLLHVPKDYRKHIVSGMGIEV